MIAQVEQLVDQTEEIFFQINIINIFESRGWGLYYYFNQNSNNLNNIEKIISFGRCKTKLEYNTKYCLFPLIEEDKNTKLMFCLIERLLESNRGPYFIDLTDEEINPIVKGVYLIDTILINPPYLELNFDLRLSKTNYDFKCDAPILSLHFINLYKLEKQLMKSWRN